VSKENFRDLMAIDFKVISIGTLSQNPLWGEQQAVRTSHATTTLISTGTDHVLVDPALPARVLDARLFERAALRIADIKIVFLTTFRACHRMGLAGFEQAEWFIHEPEKQAAERYLQEMRSRTDPADKAHRRVVEDDLSLLDRCRIAGDELADQVAIFPSPGASAGSCGVLLTLPVGTVVVAGDAVINREYLEHGRVWDHSTDLAQARRSLQDILELADIIVPGHDNVFPVMGKYFGV